MALVHESLLTPASASTHQRDGDEPRVAVHRLFESAQMGAPVALLDGYLADSSIGLLRRNQM